MDNCEYNKNLSNKLDFNHFPLKYVLKFHKYSKIKFVISPPKLDYKSENK